MPWSALLVGSTLICLPASLATSRSGGRRAGRPYETIVDHPAEARWARSFPAARATSDAGCTIVNIPDKVPLSVRASMKQDVRGLLGVEPSIGRSTDRRLRREIPRQIRPRSCMSGQGSRSPTTFLPSIGIIRAQPIPSRACSRPLRHRTVRSKSSVSPTTAKLMIAVSKTRGVSDTNQVAEGHRRCQIQRRHRGHPSAGKPRCLITSSP
jgi:hypothetical protein